MQKVLTEQLHKSFVAYDRVKESRYEMLKAAVDADWMA
jgi:hypothetical protein